MRDALAATGVGVRYVTQVDSASGHAIVMVDSEGENAIMIHPGANRMLQTALIWAALGEARPGASEAIPTVAEVDAFLATQE